MTLYRIGVGFQGIEKPLLGQHVTARGLHGVLYHVLKQRNPQIATWLHGHDSPKPYNMTPYYDGQDGTLAGIRLHAFTEQAAEMLYQSWQRAEQGGQELHLGTQSFYVPQTTLIPGPTFNDLSISPPEKEVGLRFLSPTSFRQGPGHLPLPVPANVFQWPYRVWNVYASPELRIPGDWLDWCRDNVFVTAHRIETAVVAISHKEPSFTGFVGEVQFTAQSSALLYLSLFQGLSHLIGYTGTGHKTTMGMGAVERI